MTEKITQIPPSLALLTKAIFLNRSSLKNIPQIYKAGHSGAMIALFIPDGIAQSLAIEGGLPADELHITLAYLGKAANIERNDLLHQAVGDLSKAFSPMDGTTGGIGRFCDTGEDDAFVLLPDIPMLPFFREMLVNDLASYNFGVANDHGFTPHTTLKYLAKGEPIPFDEIEPEPVRFGAISLVMAAQRFDFPFTGQHPVEKAGARHTTNEYKALSRMIEIALELGAAHPERPMSDDEKDDLIQRVNAAWAAKAGARHSRRDRLLVQEMHDLANEMGAECTRISRGPYAGKVKADLTKSQNDAPNYLPARSPKACENCIHFDEMVGNEYCGLYKFVTANNYVCDSWGHGKPDLIPGYEGKAGVDDTDVFREKNWENSTPNQRAGRDAVNNAIKAGKLKKARTKMCFRCGKHRGEEYHHTNGYSKDRQLKVRPVCSKCHSVLNPNKKKASVDDIPADLMVMASRIMALRGGRSSGNWAHSGRPGKKGGSGGGGGLKRIGVKPGSSRKKVKAAAKKAKKKGAAKAVAPKPAAKKAVPKPTAKKPAAKKIDVKPSSKKQVTKKPQAKPKVTTKEQTTGSKKLDDIFDKAPRGSQSEFNNHLLDEMTSGTISLQDAQKLNERFSVEPKGKSTDKPASKKRAVAPTSKEKGKDSDNIPGSAAEKLGWRSKDMENFEKKHTSLTDESAAIYDKSGKEIIQIKGKGSAVDFDDNQLRLMKDAIVTHNHPPSREKNGKKKDGGSFSESDLSLMFKTGASEVRAVTENYIHTVKPKIAGGRVNKNALNFLDKRKAEVREKVSKKFHKSKGKMTKLDFQVEFWHELWTSAANDGLIEYKRIER